MWRLRRGLECLPSVPFLPSCCHHLDPVVLLTCRRKEKKHLDLLPPFLSFATLAVKYFAPCPPILPVQGSDCGVAKRCYVETIPLFWYLRCEACSKSESWCLTGVGFESLIWINNQWISPYFPPLILVHIKVFSNEKFFYVKINNKFLCIERKQIRLKMYIYLFVYFTRRIEL